MTKQIVHAHRHSEYSLLDGTGSASQYAKEAARLGQTHLSLTDHGTLSGALHHYKACKDEGIFPILAMEAYFKPDRHQKDAENKTFFHLVLTAKDIRGWHNLMRISSEAYASGFYYKPCVDYDLLERYSEGIICSTACISSYLCQSVMSGDDVEKNDFLVRLRKYFGDDLFIEIMPHDFDDQRLINKELISIGNDHSIPVIATVDAHYPYKEWADTQDIMLMMATGQTHEKRKIKKERGEDVYTFDCDTLYLMNRDEVEETFAKYHPDIPEYIVEQSIDNTLEFANRCVPFMISKKQKMPKVEGDSAQIIRDWCEEGLKEKNIISNEYRERLEFELGVLEKNDVTDYIAIVGDVCRWAKSVGIRMGVGRGSAAGSLVSYLIGITHIDPIPSGLLFERFLNPDRKGMPDIDLDFESDRRIEIKHYLAGKYGSDHVADICSHQTFKPRAAIQKLCMVYDVDYKESHDVTDTMDEKDDSPLTQLRKSNLTLDAFADKYPELWAHSIRIQSQVHTLSKHAGGVVITDKPVAEYMPTMRGKQEETLTQWGAKADFNIIDEYGFMKIDVLGLRGLSMQQKAIELIEERTGERLDMNDLPVCSDPYDVQPEVMEAFTKGLVLGVNQFSGSPGFARLIKNFMPTWLGDLGAANAIYRPGPLGGGVHEQYAKRKHGEEKVNYFHPLAENALKETYATIIYQEQIMQLSKDMAGFSGGDADRLRKSISKDYRLGMAYVKQSLIDGGYYQKWVDGCAKNGINEAIMEHIWNLFLNFGEYGFNKSHAYAYAIQSYQDMWLKVNYPTEFYAALLTYYPDLAMRAIREARAFNVEVNPPNINISKADFTVAGSQIIFGLRAVKNIGDAGVKEIIENQPYHSYEDFCERVRPRACNKRAKESLIACGAFDSFGGRKGWPFHEMYEGEKENIGVCLSQAGALKKYNELIKKQVCTWDQYQRLDDGSGAIIGGEIVTKKEIKTVTYKNMGFFEVEFGSSVWNCTVWPQEWLEFKDLISQGSVVMIRGRKNIRDGYPDAVIVDTMCGIEELAMAISEDE